MVDRPQATYFMKGDIGGGRGGFEGVGEGRSKPGQVQFKTDKSESEEKKIQYKINERNQKKNEREKK